MISGIVFSKDRACQLDLFLRSVKKNAEEFLDITVLYDSSNSDFEKGYQKLKDEHDVRLIKQSRFYHDIKNILEDSKEYVCFFTDDDLIYQKISLTKENLEHIFKGPVSCFSLRMGTNTVLRESHGQIFQDNLPPKEEVFYVFDDIIAWNRTTVPTGGYWSYPLSVDGHIFRKSDIVSFVDEIICWADNGCCKKIKENPNSFEATLQRFYFELPPLMACFNESVLVNSPNNRVQDDFENYSGNEFAFSQEDLTSKYLKGYIIDLDKIDFSNIKCPHQELKLSMVKHET